MSGWLAKSDEVRINMPDGPILIENLLSQIEFQAATGGDPAVIAALWAQVQLLQVRRAL